MIPPVFLEPDFFKRRFRDDVPWGSGPFPNGEDAKLYPPAGVEGMKRIAPGNAFETCVNYGHGEKFAGVVGPKAEVGGWAGNYLLYFLEIDRLPLAGPVSIDDLVLIPLIIPAQRSGFTSAQCFPFARKKEFDIPVKDLFTYHPDPVNDVLRPGPVAEDRVSPTIFPNLSLEGGIAQHLISYLYARDSFSEGGRSE